MQKDIFSNYGSTEVGGILWTRNPTDPIEIQKTSVGRFTTCEGFEFKIEDENGNECKVGEPGEIVVLSPLRMLNYLKNRNDPPTSWVSTDLKNGFFYLQCKYCITEIEIT